MKQDLSYADVYRLSRLTVVILAVMLLYTYLDSFDKTLFTVNSNITIAMISVCVLAAVIAFTRIGRNLHDRSHARFTADGRNVFNSFIHTALGIILFQLSIGTVSSTMALFAWIGLGVWLTVMYTFYSNTKVRVSDNAMLSMYVESDYYYPYKNKERGYWSNFKIGLRKLSVLF